MKAAAGMRKMQRRACRWQLLGTLRQVTPAMTCGHRHGGAFAQWRLPAIKRSRITPGCLLPTLVMCSCCTAISSRLLAGDTCAPWDATDAGDRWLRCRRQTQMCSAIVSTRPCACCAAR
ncbi:hypothetical protein BJD12_12725 [Xanthomonas vesicatoria ATCC 35937]|nr:hypothetical protein BJD12_12725 [Xanthomonas vesicatoria ATCC 35937]KTF34844.1 hypothetical protein LMG920_04780 [Xanthomonas vesicatoria]